MNEDLTRNLPPPFEERVLAELAAIRQEQATQFAALRQEQAEQREMIGQLNNRFNSLDVRLTSLEDKVDARLRETQPIWEGVLARLTGLETEMKTLNRQFKSLINDMFKLRVRVEELEDNQLTT